MKERWGQFQGDIVKEFKIICQMNDNLALFKDSNGVSDNSM